MFTPRNQKRRPRSTCTQRLNVLFMVLAAALVVTTCGLHKDMTQSPLHEGHITIPMTALDRDGNVYHLAQATVWVAGPVHGEATLDRQISDVFRRALPSGRYTFGISGPVTLWRHDRVSGPQIITAEAVTARPIVYHIQPGELTQVVLEFHTDHGRIRFSDINLGALSKVDVVSCREGQIERARCEIPFGSSRARTCYDGQWTPWRACSIDHDVFYAGGDQRRDPRD